jgi:hypothetical protein
MHAGSAGYSSMFAKDFAREVPAELIHCRQQTDQKIDPQCFQPSMHNKKTYGAGPVLAGWQVAILQKFEIASHLKPPR